MKAIIFSAFLWCAIQFTSQVSIDYLVMSEAYIEQFRANEDNNAGYPPFFVQCNPKLKEKIAACEPAIPVLNENEGRVTIIAKNELEIYYLCLQNVNLREVFNPKHFETKLFMKKTKIEQYYYHNDRMLLPSYVNVYKYTCRSEISPDIWITSTKNMLISYRIGFHIDGHDSMILAEIEYNHEKKIPLWTKHTLYGISLAAPIAASKPLEELIYEGSMADHTVKSLIEALKTYYKFNEEKSLTRNYVNDYSRGDTIKTFPPESKISMAHLIPEYDITGESWRDIFRFARTIAPMWTDLYRNEWADVEEVVRELSFANDIKLTIYTGTHGQLRFNFGPSSSDTDKNEFYLKSDFFSIDNAVAVPQIFWKLVVHEISDHTTEAIVILLRNITKDQEDLKIFEEFTKPCDSKCAEYKWKKLNKSKILYCCELKEVKTLINEIPADVDENAKMLYHDV